MLDKSFELTLFAEHPDIVTPIGATFDKDGRLLVLESQTHFRTGDYKGPPKDRVRILEDTDGDGRADKFTTYYEGLTHAMSLALAPDGTIYVATRAKILQLLDKDKDGIADKGSEVEIARLDTPGSYPHNGLCGLTFDGDGQLWFGLGENLGEPYKLIASDGTTLEGGGEGGNIYRCKPDGSGLERIATGMWNPFAMCADPVGRIFCADNDPDKTPYCRLLHIVPGADFGYAFRYGRSGTHPLQAWQGEFPGTLPIVAPTSEAPCAILPYEGQLWGTSWGENRIERFALKPEGATWKSKPETVVQGDHEFRPVDFAQAPDASLYFTDWVSASYAVHNHGRVWRLARTTKKKAPGWPELTTGEKAAAKLRTAPSLDALKTDDLFLRQATVWGMVKNGIPPIEEFTSADDARVKLGLVSAIRWAQPRNESYGKIQQLAAADHASEEIKLAGIRWIADDGVTDLLPMLEGYAKEDKDSIVGKAAAAAVVHLKKIEAEQQKK